MQDASAEHGTEKLAPMGGGRTEFIAIVAGLMALNALAIDILLPAFPNISAAYAIDGNQVQYLLLSYVLGFGGAQLFFGPISDRYGRRIPLYVGLAIYTVCAVAGSFAPTFEMVLLFRFIQGLGAAGTRVIALAVVRDTHAGRAMASTMSLVMMVFMVVPIVAPFIGQGIIMIGPWQHIFWFMAVLAVVITAWSMARLPETLMPENRRPLSAKVIIQGFRLVLSNRISLLYTLATAFFFGSLFAFLNLAQPIFGEVYGLDTLFPVAMASGGVLMAMSSFLNARIVEKLGMRRLSHGALVAHLAFSSVAALWFFSHDVPLWLFMTILLVMMPLFGLIGANFNSIAMEPLGKVAGTASSVLGFTQTVGGGLVGAVIGQTFDGSALPLVAGSALTSLATLALVLLAEKGRLFSNPGA
ncbi:multidrug effflux MFS transporter [Oricola sp.]|uniref:multidrug effflux MFS transporter n=1 Tax=Oricola sp. TaxID=1979950 RepID=UPI0025F589BB|nr:multidrug effflux MFS transporter [Oricola sp.]MCI5075427.1 multidrug effflux MFS transporter [Oricola sp.]